MLKHMRMRPATEYTGTGSRSLYACWIANNAFVTGPTGWTFEHISAGRYNVYPRPEDVPDTKKAVAIAAVQISPDAALRAQPATRTHAVRCVPGCFEVHIFDGFGALIDTDTGLIVIVP
jgi:hypothetical protein